jgi:hypothetical protein
MFMRRVWAVLLTVLGVNLWALLALGPLELELADVDTRGWAVALYLLPLVLLCAGLATRHALVALFFFPAALIPIYLTLPEADRSVHETAAGFVSMALSTVLYAGVASAWLAQHEHRLAPWLERVLGRDQSQRALARSADDLELRSVAPPPLRRDLWWPYRWYFAPRVFFLAALFVVPAWGLNFHDGVAEAYVTGFGRASSDARVLANLIWVFLWIVAAYLFFFSPGLNLELEQRQMDASLRTFAQRALQRRSWLYAVGSAALAGSLLLVLAAWRLV